MKKILSIAFMSAIVLLATPVFAEQKPPVDKAEQAKPSEPNVSEFDKQMAKAQENLKKMQVQMDKIQQTQDPQERQKLLQVHWNSMQEVMQMMHGMWGNGMGCCMGGRGMMMGSSMMGWNQMGDYYSKLTPEQIKQQQYMMDRYMGMQQMMMDQMMQHQQHMGMPQR